MNDDRSPYIIRKVCNALDLLEQLKQGELGVSELSRRLSLQKNMVFRLLATLESRDFVEQNSSTGGYRLGPKNLEMNQGISRSPVFTVHARPILEKLTSTLLETSCLTVFKGGCIVCLNAVESPLPVRVVIQLGSWLPLYCTAAGKIHLAAMGEAERQFHLYRELQLFTPRTPVDREALMDELAQVSRHDFAVDDEELEIDIRCAAVPVRDFNSRIIGTLSVCGPSVRLDEERLRDKIIPELRRGAADLSRQLGMALTLPHSREVQL